MLWPVQKWARFYLSEMEDSGSISLFFLCTNGVFHTTYSEESYVSECVSICKSSWMEVQALNEPLTSCSPGTPDSLKSPQTLPRPSAPNFCLRSGRAALCHRGQALSLELSPGPLAFSSSCAFRVGCHNVSCYWLCDIRRYRICLFSILPKAIYEFNVIPITVLITFSTELNPKIYISKSVTWLSDWTQKAQNCQSNPEEKEQSWRHTHPDFRQYHEAPLIKIAGYWHKNRHINGTE